MFSFIERIIIGFSIGSGASYNFCQATNTGGKSRIKLEKAVNELTEESLKDMLEACSKARMVYRAAKKATRE